MIRQPRVSVSHPERASNADDALDPALDKIVRIAVLQGWDEGEVVHSIIRLGHERLSALANETENEAQRGMKWAVNVSID